jgi:PRTRC genetic system protein F
MWVLPAISPDVPLEVSRGDCATSALARFMLLAHKKGVRLPTSIFTTTMDALTEQFGGYATKTIKADAVHLPLDVDICLHDGTITFEAHANNHLDVYKLRPAVERLNAARPGLGWFIPDAVGLGHRVGLSTYDPSRTIGSCFGRWFEAESDIEMASQAMEIDESAVTAADIEAAREQYGSMPSDILEAFGGHKNLIGWSQTAAERQATKALTAAQARACLSEIKLLQSDRNLVDAALSFVSSVSNKKTDARVAPNGWDHENDEEDYSDQIGALAFVIWDEEDIPLELIGDYEQQAQGGDGCTTRMARINVELDEPAQWGNFIDAYKLYINRYAAFSNFIGQLPKGT